MTASTVTKRGGPGRQRLVTWGAFTLILLALGLLAVLVVVALDRPTPGEALHPDSPGPDGTRALVTLLGNHGHRVEVETSGDDAFSRAESGNVTLVVAVPYYLSDEHMRALADLPDTVRVVLLEPGPYVVDALGVGVSTNQSNFPSVSGAGCDLPEAVSAGDADVGGETYTVESGLSGTTESCYRQSLVVRSRPGNAEIVIVGSSRAFTNRALADNGNAALTLGLLSDHDDVVWLQMNSPEEFGSENGAALTDLLPPWIPAVTSLLFVAGFLAMLWRGRRLTAPISEPLPVIVRSTETVEGRARLYQRAKARPEAATALRTAALSRLLPLLGLGSRPDPRDVCSAVAERSGWPTDAVRYQLYGPPPHDDHTLVRLADDLDLLVAAVTRVTGPEAPDTPTEPTPDPLAEPPTDGDRTARTDEGQPS